VMQILIYSLTIYSFAAHIESRMCWKSIALPRPYNRTLMDLELFSE
jgi:hypothetical protein